MMIRENRYPPQAPDHLRPALAWFAVYMERTLTRNDYKGGWRHCQARYLFRRLREEIDEMEAAWNRMIKMKKQNRDATDVIDECADVANFAMMIADNAYRKAGD